MPAPRKSVPVGGVTSRLRIDGCETGPWFSIAMCPVRAEGLYPSLSINAAVPISKRKRQKKGGTFQTRTHNG
jgi:hypothetical protein